MGRNARNAIGAIAAVCAGLAVLINVLFMQRGSHPAPLFGASIPPTGLPLVGKIPMPAARPSPAETSRSGAVIIPRTPGEIITDIQRELLRRGYYEGPVDGFYGPKTDAAIREFEHLAALKASAEPSETLLQSMRQASPTLSKLSTAQGPSARTSEPAQEQTAPAARVIAMQRALSEYGYGQIKATGVVDADTQRAIEKFELDRNLPVTRQYSERLARELAALTGRALD